MELLVNELAKYIFPIAIGINVAASFRGATTKNETQKNAMGAIQSMMMFIIHFLGYLLLYLQKEDIKYLILYGAQLIFIITFISLYSILYVKASHLIVNNVCMLLTIGFVILARLSFDKCVRQFIFVCAGAFVSLIFPWLFKKVKSFRNWGILYLVLGLVPLVLVLISDAVFGAKLVLNVGTVSLQPTEFVKIIYVFFIAAMFNKSADFKRVCFTTLFAAIYVVILVASKDLGAALIFFVVYLIMLYVATKKWWYMLLGMCAGGFASVVAYKLFAHVRVRVMIWKDPWVYFEDQGYQICQSLFSIASGSWLGTGLGHGNPNMIPVPEKDFVFSAISEEFGAIFAILLILVCLSNVVLIMNVAFMSKTTFYKLVSLGIGATYAFQVFLTIGGGIKLIPMTGVTLPFISYGGSSVISSLIMIAIVNGLYCMRESDEVVAKKKVKGKKVVKTKKKKNVDISEKRKFNVQSTVVVVIFSILFATLIGKMIYFEQVEAAEILKSPYNTRVDERKEKVSRGSIMASNGSILAYTHVDETGSEQRIYPYGRVFSHVVGMSTRGKTGIEGLTNQYLTTSDNNIVRNAYSELSGKKLSGDNVITTLDVSLQKAAYLAMENNKGAMVVMEPSTGKVLAMVSKPDYNPNDAIDQWETWLSYTSENSVLLNRATQGLYPPGSTFKILTALQYVRENPEYTRYRYSCSGSTDVMTSVIHCYNSTAHGYETLEKAFANSCNSAFSNIGLDINGDSLNAMCEDFLFNTDIPIGIEAYKSKFVMKGNSSVGEKMQTTIGQGKTQITPLHNALIGATVANKGKMMKPYLVEKVLAADNSVIKSFSPELLSEVITEDEASAVTQFMRAVCTSGTGRSFKNTKYEVAGKTGTAQFDDVSEDSHSWFVGFAPYNAPEIVVSVVLEGGYSGYDSAQEVAKKVFDAYFGEK